MATKTEKTIAAQLAREKHEQGMIDKRMVRKWCWMGEHPDDQKKTREYAAKLAKKRVAMEMLG